MAQTEAVWTGAAGTSSYNNANNWDILAVPVNNGGVTYNVTIPNDQNVLFDLDPGNRHKLLNGLDDIGQTMQQAGKIDGFEHAQKAGFPWLYRAA